MKAFNPSVQQVAIFDHCVLNQNPRNLLIQAVAGAGKSTTLFQLVRILREQGQLGRAVLLAFNKSIATELKEKGLPASTFHSLGMSTIFRHCKDHGLAKPQIKSDKMSTIYKGQVLGMDYDLARVHRSNVLKLCSLGKNASVNPLSSQAPGELYELAAHHNIDSEHEIYNPSLAVGLAQDLLLASLNDITTIDFDDMLYLPVHLEMNFPTYKWVFVDEAQDTNLLQRQFLGRLNGGHHVFVGDRSQAIYGFRGADSSAMDLIARSFQCEELPLSVTYRCPEVVVRMAREFCPDIQAREGAPYGTFENKGADYQLHDFNQSDAVLCRNVRPLVALALRFYKMGIPAHVLGRDIGKGLLDLIDFMKAFNIPDLEEKLCRYYQSKAKDATEDDGPMLQAIEDKIDCVGVIIDSLDQEVRTLAGLRETMRTLFSQQTGITLSTIHKSKGMEWPTVYLLDENLLPSPYAKADWQLIQEDNLRYVCYTRATAKLFFISGDV